MKNILLSRIADKVTHIMCAGLLLFPVALESQTQGLHEWFRTEKVSIIEIQLDWDSLLTHKNSDREWDASVKCILPSEKSVSFKAEISARGKYRRRVCDMPPLEIDFKKKSLRKLNLDDDSDEYKLVYLCDPKYTRAQLIEKEALIYKMYAAIATHSFHIHEMLLRIKDKDGSLITEGFSFLLESNKELAKRKKFTRSKDLGKADSLDRIELYRLTLFQFMICNHDWSIDILKNIELFRDSSGNYVAVPYDFDFSGWVRPPYWVPRSDFGLQSPEDRYLFLGEVDFGILEEEWNNYREFRPLFDSLLDDSDNLRSFTRRQIRKSMDSFYKLYPEIRKGERKFLLHR